ncbi:sigma-70 family RNA polymerase sigma factor [Pantoea sp. 18069]|uniref:sigma-70 family RNA polymerase sigma factor n=1 Tax=Pantoea sp. 18069 TaxID=2681415 RepID=UPI00135BC470|nr:sigma-70 family RNA polymerase sigma factor [Pantoea sp. 18069]
MTVQTPTADTIEWLYLRHHDGLRDWIHRKLNNASHAADLAHDTFVRLLMRTQGASPPAGELREPLAYLRAIANGLMIDHWRRQTLEKAYLEALAARPEAVAPSVEERAIILETLEQIARLLEALKPSVRTAFLLAQIEGQTHAEIAQCMGVSVRTVERWMADALYRCHRILRGDTARSAS